MSRRRDLERHRHSLGEIRDIMNAMKGLAYMETRKLAEFLNAQQSVVGNMEVVAADFLSYYGDTLPDAEAGVSVYLLIGTERGFCGDINQSLRNKFEAMCQQELSASRQKEPSASPKLIVIGRKLHLLLEEDERVTAFLDGASVAEDVVAILIEVVEELVQLQAQFGALILRGLYHDGEGGIVMKELLPPFQTLTGNEPPFSHGPILNLPASDFLLELIEQYLFAALNEMLYTALMHENYRRVTHLEGAVRHLEDKSQELLRRSNTLRQEEITEEIEVILLSADSLVGADCSKESSAN